MKIGLMGFEFDSPNKGCEALTYSFISLLDKIIDKKEDLIIYNFSGTGLGEIPNEYQNIKFIDIKPKIKDIKFKYFRIMKNCDYIFDVTMGDSFSDIYSVEAFNSLYRHKLFAELLCKNYILLPQTYGPFEDIGCEKKAIKILKNAKKVYCRDEISKNLLENKYNIKNTELTTDMAFILPYNKSLYANFYNNKKKIGINVSGLLYKGGFNMKNQFDLKLDYPKFIDQLINWGISQNYEIHLIPHVIDKSNDSHDDDYKTCKKIKEKYGDCILAPLFKTPIQAKSYISNMDIFIGSRMHSTIAAFSTNVMTIPVSYSRKFEGLFNSLNYKYLINGKSDNYQVALEKVKKYIDNINNLREVQESANFLINEKNKMFEKSLINIIERKG